MRRVGILGQPGWQAGRLTAAFARLGTEGVLIDPTSLVSRVQGLPRVEDYGEAALDGLDGLLVRWLPGGTLEQVIYRVDVLHRLENRELRVINRALPLERSVDKFLTSALLEDAGLPTPRTVVTEKADVARLAFQEMGDAVLKPIFGSLGTGMVRLEDPEVAYRVFRTWEQMGFVFYLQEFIPHGTRDVRAFVLGGEVLAAMERLGDNWRTNVAKGARVKALTLTPDLVELCLTATAALGLDYAGVDLLPAEDGRWYVVEVNGIPGWRGLEEATGRDIAAELAGFLLQEVGTVPAPRHLDQKPGAHPLDGGTTWPGLNR